MQPRFYGWYNLAGVMLVPLIAGGAYYYSYGVFLPVMCDDLGWSRAVVSVGLSVSLLTMGLPGPLYGILVAKFGSKINLVLGNTVTALALGGMFFVKEPWHVYVLYGIIGFASGVGGFVACLTIVNNWFIKKRSLAMGIFSTGSGIGGFLMPPFVTLLTLSVGWRVSWLVLAGLILVLVVFTASLLIIKNKPEDIQQEPDSLPYASKRFGKSVIPPEEIPEPKEWRIRQVIRFPTTWFIIAFMAANYFALGAVVCHQVAHVEDLGFSPAVASMTLSLVSVFNIVGCLAFGLAAIKVNIRRLAIVGMLIQIIALVIQLNAKTILSVFCYSSFLGFSLGILISLMPTIVGEYYGRAHFAQILGTTMPILYLVQAISMMLAGYIFDTTSSYFLAVVLSIALSIVSLVCAFLFKKPNNVLIRAL